MHRTWIIAAAVVTLTAAASAARAQGAATPAAPASPAATAAQAGIGPVADRASLSPRIELDAAPALGAQAAARNGLTTGQKFMILGGAILITGAVIGGDAGTIIMIGGGAVGLYGLYLQLGSPHAAAPSKIGFSHRF